MTYYEELLYNIGDEIILRNGETMIITYIGETDLEGFNHKGWNVNPTKNAVVGLTGRHFSLPINKE